MSIPGTRSAFRIMVLMVAMPLLVAARVERDPSTTNNLRPGISKGTVADVYEKIALNFGKDADRLDAEAKDFTAMGEARRKVELSSEQSQPSPGLKARTDYALADDYQKMALDARDLANMNEEMARSLPGDGRRAKIVPRRSTPTAPCAGSAFVD
jgi:hypothetical protein